MAEATLTDIVDELKLINDNDKNRSDSLDDLNHSIQNWMDRMDIRMDQEALFREEQARENRDRLQLPTPPTQTQSGTGPFSGSLIPPIFAGTLLARGVASLGGILTGMGKNFNKFIVAPLLGIGKFFLKKSPLVLGITALWFLFKDIGENDAFRRIIDQSSMIWNDKMLPLFASIRDLFVSISQSDQVVGALASANEAWKSFSAWFIEDFKPVFVDGFLKSIRIGLTSLGGVFDGLKMIIEGDLLNGFMKIGDNVLKFIVDELENVVNTLLRFFGIELGIDGSFYESLKNTTMSIFESVSKWFSELKTAITFSGEDFNNFRVSLIDQSRVFFESLKMSIIDSFSGVKQWIDNNTPVSTIIEQIERDYDALVQSFNSVMDWFKTIPERLLSSLKNMLPEWIVETPDPIVINPVGGPIIRSRQEEIEQRQEILPRGGNQSTSLQTLQDGLNEYLRTIDNNGGVGSVVTVTNNNNASTNATVNNFSNLPGSIDTGIQAITE